MKPQLSRFIDIHCHILPGIDDGPSSMAESVAIGRQYLHNGVTTVVATPHFVAGTAWSTPKEKIVQIVEAVTARFREEGVALQILGGMEIAYHNKLAQRLERGELLPLGNTNHFLIEPPFHGSCSEMIETVGELARSYQLILAHPERIEFFQMNPHLLHELVDKGVKTQINSGSLLGWFGRSPRKLARQLGSRGSVHFIGSDSHNLKNRPPISIQDWSDLQRKGQDRAIVNGAMNNLKELFPAQINTA
ncbi:tyrosine-protein phosphatase [Desulforhopalus singaporensis]|uniref:protein-tyrosine-phosphatase n=1 Tax=Desulforhopalus singaporensis TaxID=91360 RepID=A0A1H0UYA7_9BACT|nr:CpsB/CapC family capsule biosynthesis tyrosine phosphatase [Desulforhopalus singaporensis]SDP71269.1 protein-tyrosine phosphatase [Desulforhopalus singaporensis]